MGYYLQAAIGKRIDERISAPDGHVRIVSLSDEFSLVPITDELFDALGGGVPGPHFEKLSPAVEQWVKELSRFGPIAYVEAEFSGGVGSQSAVVYDSGAVIVHPIHSTDAINQALRHLGASKGDATDEFEALGLPMHRNTRDWR